MGFVGYTARMKIQSVGIAGYGAFGAFVHVLLTRFAPDIQVRVHSSRNAPDGETFFSAEDVAECDALVFAVPISAFEETLVKFLPLMRADTIIVDVATVKMHTVEILKRLAGDRHYIATHPMFGPESYEKKAQDVSGFRIVIADSTLPLESVSELVEFLKTCGFDVVQMTAADHDKHLAETLFLTHFIGQIVSKAGFNRTEIDTVSFGYLMNAVESVQHDTQLFQDVFKFNPFCADVLDRFEMQEGEVRKLLEK